LSHVFLYVKVCFEVHRLGKTDNVLVAGLVHRGEQIEEGFQWGMEDHGADFFVLQMLLDGWLLWQQDGVAKMMTNDKSIPSRDLGNLLRAPSPRQNQLEKWFWRGWEIPTNSILAAASK
jgi:hypothetical protein